MGLAVWKMLIRSKVCSLGSLHNWMIWTLTAASVFLKHWRQCPSYISVPVPQFRTHRQSVWLNFTGRYCYGKLIFQTIPLTVILPSNWYSFYIIIFSWYSIRFNYATLTLPQAWIVYSTEPQVYIAAYIIVHKIKCTKLTKIMPIRWNFKTEVLTKIILLNWKCYVC